MKTQHQSSLDRRVNQDEVDFSILNGQGQTTSAADPLRWKVIVLYGLILVSIFTYFFTRFYQNNNSEEYREEPLQLEKVLLTSYHFGPNDFSGKKETAPDSILQFINQLNKKISSVQNSQSNKVVLFEILEEKQQKIDIDNLLSEARHLFKRDHLTSPEGNNALEHYQTVLAVESKNIEALKGIKKIVDRYISLANIVIKKGDDYKVTSLIQKANKVGNPYMDMKPILQKYSKYIDASELFLGAESASPDVDKKHLEKLENLTTRQVIIDADLKIASAAYKLMESGNLEGSRMILERFNDVFDFWGKSCDLLLELYLKEKLYAEAKALINENSDLNRHLLAEKIARVFAAEDEVDDAIKLLETHIPEINTYPNYYALLAGLHFFHQNHEKSSSMYRHLIELQHNNAKYWLGLAVSLSALNDPAAAKAFEYAKEYADSNSLVLVYINQQLLASVY
jgi:predicted negative regulator of RcsB-dependent stress response